MDAPVVQFESVRFEPAAGPAILRSVDLTCSPGETVAIVGRSGAGKSTLLKLVNRLLVPSSGRVLVEGRSTLEWDPIRLRRHIGYVIQDAGLFPHMTVEENVTVVPRLEHWDAPRARTRAHDLLDLVGLAPDRYATRRPAQLSGGERQRVGLARALAADPPIVLMDEPFGALDPMTRAEVSGVFVRIREQLNTSALLVTHDMDEARALGDRVGVMEAGELIALDTPDVLARSTDPRVQGLLSSAVRVRRQ